MPTTHDQMVIIIGTIYKRSKVKNVGLDSTVYIYTRNYKRSKVVLQVTMEGCGLRDGAYYSLLVWNACLLLILLSIAYYAQNYSSIICQGLAMTLPIVWVSGRDMEPRLQPHPITSPDLPASVVLVWLHKS